jgi:three-Cys-motif partner protein
LKNGRGGSIWYYNPFEAGGRTVEELDYYRGREQSLIKHEILRKYLQRLTYKIVLGLKRSQFTLTYIDGFSGPWQSRSETFSDTSFQIAINELRAARDALADKYHIRLNLRCLFVEKEEEAFLQLENHLKDLTDIELKLIHGEFEKNIPQALEFARLSENLFTFIFIDPTGWTGFGLKAITPLLQLWYSEVLINFMTKDIIRFIDDPRPEIRTTFQDLFGTDEVQRAWSGLQGREREEAIVEAYRQRLKEVVGYKYAANAVVFHPEKDRTHFNLIYGTRNLEGLRTFRDSERKAMVKQNQIRNVTKQERQIERTRNLALFSAEEVGSDDYYQELRTRFFEICQSEVVAFLETRKGCLYKELLSFLEIPLIYEKDIQELLWELKRKGIIEIAGMTGKERVIKADHAIAWK